MLLPDGTEMLEDRHGCVPYMALELFTREPYSAKPAFHSILIGQYPFFDTRPQSLISKICSGHCGIAEHVSYLACSLIASMVQLDPRKRPRPEAMLAHQWLHHRTHERPSPESQQQQVKPELPATVTESPALPEQVVPAHPSVINIPSQDQTVPQN